MTDGSVPRARAVDPATSAKLRALAMLGILAVIVGHAPSYRDPSAPSARSFGYAWGEYLGTDALPRVFVMVFFAVSGFLLLLGHDGTWATWRQKLAARTRSLLVPYLVWSALGLLLYAVLQSLPWTAPWFANSARRVVGRSPTDLLLLWLVDPVPYQLWFLRDLFAMVLLGPLWLAALRVAGWWVPALLLVPHAFDLHVPSPVVGIRLVTADCYLWFVVGGACAVRGLPHLPNALLALCTAGMLVGAAVRAYGLADGWPSAQPNGPWFKLVHLFGVPAVWGLYDRALRWLERPFFAAWSGISFFVFVAHEPFMTMLRKPLIRLFGQGDPMHALQCATSLVGTVLAMFALGAWLRRAWPRTFAFLCGGRG